MSDDYTRPTPVDLDAVRRRLHHVRNSIAFGPTSRRLAHTDVPAMMAEIEWSRAEIERLSANQLPDGGEWRTEYGHTGGGRTWFDAHPCSHPECNTTRRVWTGPAEPVTETDQP